MASVPALARMSCRFTLMMVMGASAVLVSCGEDGSADLPAVEAPLSPRLEVEATEMAYAPSEIAVAAGPVEVVLTNTGGMLHDLRIDGEPFIMEAAPGRAATGTVVLDAGRYRIFCSLPGHRAAGMEGILEVRP
jgi:uncharacterized cupredoxin-like copper-binding protein